MEGVENFITQNINSFCYKIKDDVLLVIEENKGVIFSYIVKKFDFDVGFDVEEDENLVIVIEKDGIYRKNDYIEEEEYKKIKNFILTNKE